MPRCRIAVLGVSGRLLQPTELRGRPQDCSQEGVGKSSLCSRFVRPKCDWHERFGEDHLSVVSISDFQDAEFNEEHFLYFGRATRDYLPSEAQCPVALSIDLLEHSEFVDDACYRTLGVNSKPYLERATQAKLCSPGKVAYRCRSHIGDNVEERDEFPVEFGTQGVDGYVFVLDPCSREHLKSQQIRLLDQCLARLPKNKPVVVVLSKCDNVPSSLHEKINSPDFDLVQYFLAGAGSPSLSEKGASKKRAKDHLSIRCVAGKMELKRNKTSIPFFLSSARDGVGVDAPFLYLAHTILRLPGSSPKSIPFVQLADLHTQLKQKLRSFAKGVLRHCVEKEESRWEEKQFTLRQSAGFQRFEEVCGEEEAKGLFSARLVEISLKRLGLDICSLSRRSMLALPPSTGAMGREVAVEKVLDSLLPTLSRLPTFSREIKRSLSLYIAAPLDLPPSSGFTGDLLSRLYAEPQQIDGSCDWLEPPKILDVFEECVASSPNPRRRQAVSPLYMPAELVHHTKDTLQAKEATARATHDSSDEDKR